MDFVRIMRGMFGKLDYVLNFVFCLKSEAGDVAEWLGRGLQNLVQRFESARRLPFFPFGWKIELSPTRAISTPKAF